MKKVNSVLTILGLFVAIILGFFAPGFIESITFIGDWYVKLLKILIGPVVFCSMSIAILKGKKENSKLIVRTVGLFVLMFAATFLLTSVIVSISKVGVGFNFTQESVDITNADFSILAILKNLLPTSFENLLYGKNIFFVIIVSLVLSLIISLTPINKKYTSVLEKIKEYLSKALEVIIILTPIAIVSLVGDMIVKFGSDILLMGGRYILMAYGCSILAIIVIMIVPVWIIGKINPFTYIKRVSKIWLITLSTCSSVATLPHTIKVCNQEFGIDEKITNVVVPLGCTIHMCGGAVSFALLGIFVCQMYNMPISIGMYLYMLLSATLINMAAPGIPGGGVIIGFSYLSLIQAPIGAFYGFYSGIYKLLDMAYTTLNVTGDISANIIIQKISQNKKQ